MITFGDLIAGFPIVEDKNCWQTVWVFPKDRFITYEKKDEEWCRPLGIGHQEIHPGCYLIQYPGEPMTLLIHPDLLKQLRKEAA